MQYGYQQPTYPSQNGYYHQYNNQSYGIIHPQNLMNSSQLGIQSQNNYPYPQQSYQQQQHQQYNYQVDTLIQPQQIAIQPQQDDKSRQYYNYASDNNTNANNLNYQYSQPANQYKINDDQAIYHRQPYSDQSNVSQLEDLSLHPSTIGIIEQQLIVVKQKEEQNVQSLNLKRKHPDKSEEVIGPHKKDEKQFEKLKDMSFIETLVSDLGKYFTNKPLSVFLREYCSKVKLIIDIACDENDKGLGFTSSVVIDGVRHNKGMGKNKKDAKEDAALQALKQLCEKDASVKNHFVCIIDKEKNLLEKFKNEKEKSSGSDSKNSGTKKVYKWESLENYNPQINYREDLTQLAQQVLRLTAQFEIKGEANNWESICKLGNLVTMALGISQKDAKNTAAYRMINLVEQANEHTVKKLAKKALVKQKIDITSQKLKGMQKN